MWVVSSGGSLALPGAIAPRNSPASQSANKTRGQVGDLRAITCSFDGSVSQDIVGVAGNELAGLYAGQAAGTPSGRSDSLTSGQVSTAALKGGGARELARRHGQEKRQKEVFWAPDTSARPWIRRQLRTASKSVASRFCQLPNVAAVSPKGRWGWIDSDRCWCRNREHLLKVHRLDRD